MLWPGYDARGNTVVETAFALARSSGTLGPLHLLVAIAEDDSAAAESLRPRTDRSLRVAVCDELGPMRSAVAVDFRARQILGSVQRRANRDGTAITAEHLLVALTEQASPEVRAACDAAGVDLGRARDIALNVLGWSSAAIPALAAVEPAGSMDRPPLALGELPVAAWAALRDRQQRLPFRRIRRTWQWYGLSHNEARAARRIVDRHCATDDERSSLLHHHREAVNRLAVEAISELLPPPPDPSGPMTRQIGERPRRHLIPRGWICGLGNRRTALRDRWFQLTYRY